MLAQAIDSGFVIGFLTVIALLLSLIQSVSDKRYAYNLKLVESIEDKGLRVIGKLIQIKQKSELILKNLMLYQGAIKDRRIAEDANNTLTKNDLESGMELIVAYIDTYFPDQKHRWGQILDKLSVSHTHNLNVVRNYTENLELIIKGINFKNKELGNLDKYVKDVESLNIEVNDLTFELKNSILLKINESKEALKKGFYLRF